MKLSQAPGIDPRFYLSGTLSGGMKDIAQLYGDFPANHPIPFIYHPFRCEHMISRHQTIDPQICLLTNGHETSSLYSFL